jgi:predicted MPP superfamily phosphohydrolase
MTTHLQLSNNVNNCQTFIHKCSLLYVNFEEIFHYNIFGWDGSTSNPIAFFKDFISVTIADVTNVSRKMTIIALADWSPLDKNNGKYVPLDGLFASVIRNQEINGLMIGGDVGYDLDSNNCLNYERFLVMLSGIAKTVPVIMVTGNHEYNTDDNYKLFQYSFQMYGLDNELATHLQIGPLSLLPFDPF